jgi:hypothetical protein
MMGFSELERVNIAAKALQAGVVDANPNSVWYEVFNPFTFVLAAEQVWTEMTRLRALPASNLTTAQANAAANPNLIQDRSDTASATQMTLVPGTNFSTYASYATPGDLSSAQLRNWLLPQLVQQPSGAPSNGYAIQLYNGDPNAGGVLVTTTEGTTGAGPNKTVGWTFSYANGLLLFSADFYTETGIVAAAFTPYIVGFRYIGKTAGDSGAPDDAQYVTLAADSDLPNARTLTGGTGIDLTDNGAGATVEVKLDDTGVTPAEYSNATITVDQQGRITAAESGTGGSAGLRSSFVKPGGWP